MRTRIPLGNVWRESAIAAPPSHPLDGDGSTEIVVVGAGFTGLSIALHLAESGVSTVVLEAGEIGGEASGRSSGQLIRGFKLSSADLARRFDPARYDRLAHLGDSLVDYVFDLVETHGIACHGERKGWIRAAHNEPSFKALARTAEDLKRRNQNVVLLSAGDMERYTGSAYYHGGLLDPEAGALQPLSYARGLAAAALRKGARIYTGTEATGLERRGDGWAVICPQGKISCRQVVFATGAETRPGTYGIEKSFIPVDSCQIATKPLDAALRKAILPTGIVVSDSRKLTNFFRFDPAGRLIVGGRGSQGDASTERALLKAARDRFPILADVEWGHKWSARVDLTLDNLPHLSSPDKGIWTLVGFGGRGIALGTALGRLVAQKLTGNASGDIFPVTPLPRVPFYGARSVLKAAGIAFYKICDRFGIGQN